MHNKYITKDTAVTTNLFRLCHLTSKSIKYGILLAVVIFCSPKSILPAQRCGKDYSSKARAGPGQGNCPSFIFQVHSSAVCRVMSTCFIMTVLYLETEQWNCIVKTSLRSRSGKRTPG